MVSKLNILFSRNKVKELLRENLEEKFMRIQEDLFKKNQEIKKLREKLKETKESQKTQEANKKAHQPTSKAANGISMETSYPLRTKRRKMVVGVRARATRRKT